jgi:hypothetical protein
MESIGIPREPTGAATREVVSALPGISEASFFAGQAAYGGIARSGCKAAQSAEEKKAFKKKLIAESMLGPPFPNLGSGQLRSLKLAQAGSPLAGPRTLWT